jgi:hypothetical protein
MEGVSPESITSIHLPPGTSQPRGLSVAPGNVGDITDFVHNAFGERVEPKWLTVHTTRTFDYREHVERLATITEVGGYPLAVENTPDASCYHTPEDIAALAFLARQVPRLDDVSILIDTAHVAMERCVLTVDVRAFESVYWSVPMNSFVTSCQRLSSSTCRIMWNAERMIPTSNGLPEKSR